MKGFYLAVSVFLTFIILIIAFENINSMLSHFYFLFFPLGSADGFFLVGGLSIIGILIGIFSTIFVTGILKKGEDEATGSEIFN